MYLESAEKLSGSALAQWRAFLARSGLVPEEDGDLTVLLWDDDRNLLGCGSRKGNLLKCIAVDPSVQGEGLTGKLITALRQDAFARGFAHLFLYTKPRNRMLFEPLFFYPVAKTEQVLLMENRRGGISEFLAGLENGKTQGKIGAIVMNADPFTLGHQYLVRQAAASCDWLYVFVLSEDAGSFSARDRMEMVRRGTAELHNVTVNPTGPYLISGATFPSYFLKDRGQADRQHCLLDLAVFTKWFAPRFGITHRFAGSEPECAVTALYNRTMAQQLPAAGISFVEIPRLEAEGRAVSAGTVRRRLINKENIRDLVPESTYRYLEAINRI